MRDRFLSLFSWNPSDVSSGPENEGSFLTIRSRNGFLLNLTGKRKERCSIFLSIHWLILVDCFPFPHLMRTYEEGKIPFYLLSVKNYVYPELSFVLTVFSVVIKMVQIEEVRWSPDPFRFMGISVWSRFSPIEFILWRKCQRHPDTLFLCPYCPESNFFSTVWMRSKSFGFVGLEGAGQAG